jgi:hypothetical protein
MFFHRPGALTRPGGESAEIGGFALGFSAPRKGMEHVHLR